MKQREFFAIGAHGIRTINTVEDACFSFLTALIQLSHPLYVTNNGEKRKSFFCLCPFFCFAQNGALKTN